MNPSLFIDHEWSQGSGDLFESINPINGQCLWRGAAAGTEAIDSAVRAARRAQLEWSAMTVDERMVYIRSFHDLVKADIEGFARTISNETGKPLWESKTEVSAVLGKIDISHKAYWERTGERESRATGVRSRLRHRAHGVVAILGPYNFPAHLPNGHIVPALIAGNTIVFKPSELTPLVAERMTEYWQQVNLPPGVFNLVQGAAQTGKALAEHAGIDGLFFTGSSRTGKMLQNQFAGDTGRILALEMGGNNPLLVWNTKQLDAAAYHTVQSTYLSAGQRCTCARRLILQTGEEGDHILRRLQRLISNIIVGAPDDLPEPFMGPVISNCAADRLMGAQQRLLELGAKPIIEMTRPDAERPMLTPGLLECTGVSGIPDEEYFGPLLQLYRANDLEEAIRIVNNTRYGLSAGVLSDSAEVYQQFYTQCRAGIVNWNRPLTGASSALPFGGTGASGNHNPGAYYAADYCAYPVASLESDQLTLPKTFSPGLLM